MSLSNSDYLSKINRPLHHDDNNESLISIFSGICGLDIGLERAGFRTRYALDFDKHCKDVIEQNRDVLGDFPFICGDITKISADDILNESRLQTGEVSLIAGGPPCQPFSKSGLRKGIDDEKGQLFKIYLDYLEIIKPKAFILENVRGLVSSNKGEDFKKIIELFEETGYTIYWKILDAANHGVPQFRQRLFIVGFRERIHYSFPKETHGGLSDFGTEKSEPYAVVWDAIGDLEEVVDAPRLKGKYAHLLEGVPEGMNYSFYTAERGHPNPLFKWRSKFWYFLLKSDRNKPSLTIQAYPGNNTGPFHWRNRRLAVREILRIQSFPDWFKLEKSYMASHRLVGNAVPPLLAEEIGKSIKNALDEHVEISYQEYLLLRASHANGFVVKSGRGSGKSRLANPVLPY